MKGLLRLGSLVSAAMACGLVEQGGTDAGQDGPSDGPDAGAGDASVQYSDITDVTKWETIDVSGFAGGGGDVGATFDGRYVYYVPGSSVTVLLRYDTTQPFTVGNWQQFDLTQVLPTPGFAGAVFDGTYVYLTPFAHGIEAQGTLVRFNTTAPFDAGSSYEVNAVPCSGCVGFSPSSFDGKHLYLTPGVQGNAVRFDVTSAFDASASYENHLVSSAIQWSAGAFDGRFVYLAPYVGIGTGTYSGDVQRYDTNGDFAADAGGQDVGGWSDYDLATHLDANAVGFQGAIFDGRYIYLVPSHQSLAVRYDTQAPFAAATSWQTMHVGSLTGGIHGYSGGTFDGRYVYYVPMGDPVPQGVAIRYDTQQPFDSTSAWQTFDLMTQNANAKGFQGAAFDGRYVYFVPYRNGVAVRFDARTPPRFPPFNASFF